LLEAANELLTGRGLSKVSGIILDRMKGEAPSTHLSRIRGYLSDSIGAGFPPIVEVRAMAARKSDAGYTWTDICAHTFTVLDATAVNWQCHRHGVLDSDCGFYNRPSRHVICTCPGMPDLPRPKGVHGLERWRAAVDLGIR